MVQLTRLAEGVNNPIPVADYPFRIGRAPGDHLRLQVAGVWAGHCTLEWHSSDGVYLRPHPEALTSVNGQPVKVTRLRNGDIIECGSARLAFGLRPVSTRDFRFRELLVWLALAAVGGVQVILMLGVLP